MILQTQIFSLMPNSVDREVGIKEIKAVKEASKGSRAEGVTSSLLNKKRVKTITSYLD